MSVNYMELFELADYYGFNETNELYSKLNCDVNLITFQSLDVIKILLKNKVYMSDPSKAREKQDYGADIDQLGGHTPVWCFSPFNKDFGYRTEFHKGHFRSGGIFTIFSNEMCLQNSDGFNRLFMLELRVPSSIIKVGVTRNGYEGAVVIPKIEIDNLVAVYKYQYRINKITKESTPYIKVLKIFKDNSLFNTDFEFESNMERLKRIYLDKK